MTAHASTGTAGFPSPTIKRDGWTYPNPEFPVSIDVRRLVSPATLRLIGARHKSGEFSKGYAVWTIKPPVISDHDGRHFLAIQCAHYGISLALLAEYREDRAPQMLDVGYGAFKAWVRHLAPDQADAWVRLYCTQPRDVVIPAALGWHESPSAALTEVGR